MAERPLEPGYLQDLYPDYERYITEKMTNIGALAGESDYFRGRGRLASIKM